MSAHFTRTSAMSVVVLLAVACGPTSDEGASALPKLDRDEQTVADEVTEELARRQAQIEATLTDGATSSTVEFDHRRAWLEDQLMSEPERRCFAVRLVDQLGVEEVRRQVLTGGTSRDVASVPGGGFLDAQTCHHDWKQLIFKYQTEGTDQISDESLQCMADSITDEEARAMAKALDDFVESPELDAVFALYAECLTSTELARLDWN